MLSYSMGYLKRRHISCENSFFQEPLYEMVAFYMVNADEGNRDMENIDDHWFTMGALTPSLFFAVHIATPFESSADRQMSFIISKTYKGSLFFWHSSPSHFSTPLFTVENAMKLSGSNSLALALLMLVTMKSNIVQGRELACVLGGDLACYLNCLHESGNISGKCNKDDDCICEKSSTSPQQP